MKTRQEARLDSLNSRMTTAIRQSIITQQSLINALEVKMPIFLNRCLMAEQHRLQLIEEKTKNLDPALLLKRGYSITLHNGKAVRSPQQLQSGDEIETRLEKGTIKSIIK